MTPASGCGGDAFTSSTQATVDGGADASIGGDGAGSDDGASGSSWCASQTTKFCADFDEATEINPLLSSWSSFEASGGQFTFDSDASVPSPPNALVATATATSNASPQVLLIQTMPAITARPTSTRLEFDLRIDQAGMVGALAASAFAVIVDGTNASDGVVALAIGSGPKLAAAWTAPADAGTEDGTTYGGMSSTQPFPTTGSWSGRYAIDITYSGTTTKTACAQIYQGATPLLSPCLPLPASFVDPKVLSIALGVFAAGLGNIGNMQVEFDNVTFDY
jgi:hypothetical protein